MKTGLIVFVSGMMGLLCVLQIATTQASENRHSTVDDKKVDRKKLETTTRKAIDYLKSSQSKDGSWDAQLGIGVTGLITYSLLKNGVPPTDPVITKSLAYLQSHVKASGGIHQDGTFYRNYETSLAIQCFSQADKMSAHPKYTQLLSKAGQFLKDIQWKAGEGIEDSDPRIGGAGYGKHGRPDLSNTSMMIDALRSIDTAEDDPAIQAAIKFVSKCQNLESEHNTTPDGAKVNDGGFYYAIGETKAEKVANGGLRSYASMTYAGFKSLLYAGVDKDDIRVVAARDWISKHYDLQSNPGMGQQGLYYYYHIFAKALDAFDEDLLVDEDGNKHNWRADLVDVIASKQAKDGSWINDADRWYEGSSNLCAAYCLLALSHCDQDKKK